VRKLELGLREMDVGPERGFPERWDQGEPMGEAQGKVQEGAGGSEIQGCPGWEHNPQIPQGGAGTTFSVKVLLF